ncbi:MAG: hypothetical protein HY280_10285, partial [Nitrospinae bacterium]|nr:hypothetical protein [Nitrospinota bacterium]
LTLHPSYGEKQTAVMPFVSENLRGKIDNLFPLYLLEGGFPEVWSLPDWETKQAYLYDNQIKKVIMEDLVLATELRKPENLKNFFISLLERPGREINFGQIAGNLGISLGVIEKFFPLLEMTDLIRHVGKFSKGGIRVRKGNIKCYLVDLALRNAVMRVDEEKPEVKRNIFYT